MLTDKTIYVKLELQKIGTGPQVGQIRYRDNYRVFYGAAYVSGPNKWDTIQNMVRMLRKMHADGALGDNELAVPEHYSELESFIVPADIIDKDVADFVDIGRLKRK